MHWVVFIIAFLCGGFIGIMIMAFMFLARRDENETDKYAALFIDKNNS